MRRGVQVANLDFGSLLLLLLLVIALWLAYNMIYPFLDSLIIAGLAVIILNPIHQRVLSMLGGRSSLAAFVTSLLLAAIVAVTGFLVLWKLFQELVSGVQTVVHWLNSDAFQEFMKKPVIVRIVTAVNRYWAEIQTLGAGPKVPNTQIREVVIQAVTSVGKKILNQGSYAVENAAWLLMDFVLMIIAFFFMVRDQERLRGAIFRVLPFTRGHQDTLSERVATITRSALLGIFLTAAAQGAGAAVAFWVCGIPVLLGAMATGIASFIPLIGTGVVWLPATLYLLFTDHIGLAIFLTVWWGIVIAFLLDNVLRSLLVSEGAQMSTPLVFFSIIGGIYFFGLMGVLYGPLVLGALHLLFDLYATTLSARTEQDSRIPPS